MVKCRPCGLMRTTPCPTLETIYLHYPDNYGPYVGTQTPQGRQTSRPRKLLLFLVKGVISLNATRLQSLAWGQMLEVDCASNSFLDGVSSRGGQVQGIELSERAATAATQSGYRVHGGQLETAPQPDESFGLIAGRMTLEHLDDPVGGPQKRRQIAAPGAWLALLVANPRSWELVLFSERWHFLPLPHHFHCFTPATIKRVLQLGGHILERASDRHMSRNLMSRTGCGLLDMGYVRLTGKFGESPAWGERWALVIYLLAYLFSLLGQTGRMAVCARASA